MRKRYFTRAVFESDDPKLVEQLEMLLAPAGHTLLVDAVELRPEPAAGRDVWVLLPANADDIYHTTKQADASPIAAARHVPCRALDADELAALRSRGVCVEFAQIFRTGVEAAAGRLECLGAEMLLGRHGLAAVGQDMKIGSYTSTVTQNWARVRLPD